MSRFTEALVVTPLADGKTWVILRDFGYDVGEEGSRDCIDVAIGFQTDFATVPRALWIFLPRWGRYGNAAVVHDWLYWTQERQRHEADAIFREAMEVLGVGRLKKSLMYWAVRAFGRFAWYRNRADRAAGFKRVLEDVHVKAASESKRRGAMGQVARYTLAQLRS